MKIVGITGSIASGKSEVSNYISLKSYNIIDADFISRDITKKGNLGYKAIIDEFSKDILDENKHIDRKKLSKIVFDDKIMLEKLNSLLHPIILKKIDEQIEKYKNDKIVFLDAPLLFETGLFKKCDKIILIHCNEKTQIQRLMQRDGIDSKKAKQIIQSQLSVSKKKKKSDYIIENNESIQDLYFKIDNILNIINFLFETL